MDQESLTDQDSVLSSAQKVLDIRAQIEYNSFHEEG